MSLFAINEMTAESKNNSGLTYSWIEHESQEISREFRKYWEEQRTPQNKIEDLIQSEPDQAAEIIVQIAQEIAGNEKLETKLICGLIYDFEHLAKDKYVTILLEKLKHQSIFKYLNKS